MVKILGIVLVICSAGGFGIAKGIGYYSQLHAVTSFYRALEILKCEMNYTLSPLPKLFKTVSNRSTGISARFFEAYSALLERGMPRSHAARTLLSDEKKYRLPQDAQLTLLELFENLGAYELDGENRILRIASQRLHASAERLEQEKKPLAKSYAVLGVCSGLALVILCI